MRPTFRKEEKMTKKKFAVIAVLAAACGALGYAMSKCVRHIVVVHHEVEE